MSHRGPQLSGPFARVVRVCVALSLTAVLLWLSDPAAVVEAGRGAELRFIFVACVLVVVDRALMAYRWLTLLTPLDPGTRPPFSTVMRIFFLSTFVGTFLPASIGGDAVRAYGLSQKGVLGPDAVASVLMDRLLGIVSILIVATIGLFLARHLIDVTVFFWALLVLAGVCVAGLGVVFSPSVAGVAGFMIARLPRGQHTAQRLVAAIRRYSTHRAALANVLICSIGVQALRVLQTFFLGLALMLPTSLWIYFALVPLILLIVLMPVTIAGIGTTQAAFVWLFGRAGVPPPEAFALSVLFLAIAVVGNLPGGLLYLFDGMKSRSAGV